MSQAPVTWQAPSLPYCPTPPTLTRGRAVKSLALRTPLSGQARPSRPILLPPSNGRGAGQAEQAAAAQPRPRPVLGSRAGRRRPLNAAQGQRDAALATFLLRAATAAPCGRKQPRLGSRGLGSSGHLRPAGGRRLPSPPPPPGLPAGWTRSPRRARACPRVCARPSRSRTRAPARRRTSPGSPPARCIPRPPRSGGLRCTPSRCARRWRDRWPTVMP